jgi:iron complex transport system substrate-binding protein
LFSRTIASTLLALLLGALACERAPAADATVPARGASRAPAAGGAPATDAAAVHAAHAGVIDDTGRPLRPAAPPRRIISLIPAVTETLVALGVRDRLVARTDYDRDPALAALPSVGGGLTPSVEWLASRQPDLVVAWPDATSRSLVERLRALDIPVYAACTETLDDAQRTIRNLGELLGIPARADSLENALRAGLDSVRADVAGRPRPTVLYLAALDPPAAAGPGTFIGELIDAAGGRNILDDAGSPWPQVAVEEIVRRRPDVVILSLGGPGAAGAAERLRTLPGWSELPAVRHGRVHTVDPDRFNRPGPGVVRAARALAALLHPAAAGGTMRAPDRPAGVVAP